MSEKRADPIIEFWLGVEDAIRFDVFRRCYALTLIVYVLERARTPFEWLTDAGFHPSREAMLWYFPPISPTMPAWLVYPFLAVYLSALACLVLGRFVRVCSWIAFVCVVYTTTADYASAYTLNILYMLGFCIFAISPAPVTQVFKGEPRQYMSAWPIRVLQCTIAIQYFTAGLCKVLHGDWLVIGGPYSQNAKNWSNWFNHDVQSILWSHAQGIYCTDLCAWMLRTLPRWTWTVQQYLALGFELGAPIVLGVKRLRWVGILWGAGFVIIIALTMNKLIYFVLQLLCFFILFIDASYFYRLRDVLKRSSGATGRTLASDQ